MTDFTLELEPRLGTVAETNVEVKFKNANSSNPDFPTKRFEGLPITLVPGKKDASFKIIFDKISKYERFEKT